MRRHVTRGNQGPKVHLSRERNIYGHSIDFKKGHCHLLCGPIRVLQLIYLVIKRPYKKDLQFFLRSAACKNRELHFSDHLVEYLIFRLKVPLD